MNPDFPAASRADEVVHIRRNTLKGAGVSLLVHILALLLLHPLMLDQNGDGGNQPISVELNLEDPPGKEHASSAPPPPQGQPDQPPRETPPHRSTEPVRNESRRVIATNRAAPDAPVIQTPPPEPQPRRVPAPAEEVPPPPPGVDFSTYTQQRLAQLPKSQGGQGKSAENDPNAARDAAIARNLQRPGTSGVFEIRSKSAFKATFSFKGWTVSQAYSHQQLIDVSVEPGQDIDLAIVRRMITLIREYYSGDFTWDSHRVGPIQLSARPKDQAGLEAFMMMEFFGTPPGGLPPSRR